MVTFSLFDPTPQSCTDGVKFSGVKVSTFPRKISPPTRGISTGGRNPQIRPVTDSGMLKVKTLQRLKQYVIGCQFFFLTGRIPSYPPSHSGSE